MSLGEYRGYGERLTDGAVRAAVHARRVHDQHAVCDIVLCNLGGNVVAEMIGVETVLRPAPSSAVPSV